MPIIKSAIKRMRQQLKRRARNIGVKRSLRTSLKTLASNQTAENINKAQSEIDKAVKKNLLNKNTAARKKAQLAKKAKEAGVKIAKRATKPAAEKKPAAKTTTKKTTAAKKPAAKKTTTKKAEK